MSKDYLVMKYHPAKKEVVFHRFDGDCEIPIRNDSKLRYYMNQRGKFVLQDHGVDFFADVAKAFDGQKEVRIQAVTTKLDYEDFVQMVEYYNEEAVDCKFTTTLLAELPDMTTTYSAVKEHGESAIATLSNHGSRLFDIPLDNDQVKDSAQSFSNVIHQEKLNIREKITSLSDNNVSLCFTGVYSSGKSSLINALLGYHILPEAVTSETAKMVKISSPKTGEQVSIRFLICGIPTTLQWDGENAAFDITEGPSESIVRTELQNVMNREKEKNERLDQQILAILKELNGRSEISTVIDVKFPVSLDTDKVQFTLYDTPGSDSNFLEHQQVLEDALAEQTQSILIFVVHPTKLEGEGNNVLLNYLKRAEEKNSKTSIDIGRSLFVVNYSDTIKKTDREQLRYKDIKNKDDDSFSIQLAGKKLLYTTARYGLAAKAVMNNTANDDEKWWAEDCNSIIATAPANPNGPCYMQNQIAASEQATSMMIRKSDTARQAAHEDGDRARELYVCSGLYALETEIKTYGEKYASAVKAYAIIDSVDKALKVLSSRANSLTEQNKKSITDIDDEIEKLKDTIGKAIRAAEAEVNPADDGIMLKNCRTLGIDSDSLIQFTSKTVDHFKNVILKSWFDLKDILLTDKRRTKAEEYYEECFAQFRKSYSDSRRKLLKDQRDRFLESVKKAIEENGDISKAAKEWMSEIEIPKIPDIPLNDLNQLFDSSSHKKKIIIEFNLLNKESFVDDIRKDIRDTVEKMADSFKDEYRKALDPIIEKIVSQYWQNLETYSITMKRLIENRSAMLKLGEKLSEAAKELEGRQKEMNEIIWKEISRNDD